MRFEALREFKGLWRVDGVPEAVYLGDKLNLKFVLTPVFRNGEGYSPVPGKKPEFIVSTPRCLNMLTIGSVWDGPERVEKPEILPPYFEVDTSDARNCVPSYAINLGGKYSNDSLSKEIFGTANIGSALATGSYKVIRIENNYTFKWMIISPSELLRYYTGRSNLLITSFLRGEEKSLIDWSRKPENSKPIISEKISLKPVERKILARTLISQSCKDALQSSYRSISAASVESSITGKPLPLTLHSDFPFKGKTRLRVSGRVVQIAGEYSIFVNEIFNCTYPLGFDTLRYEPCVKPVTGGQNAVAGTAVSHYAYEDGADDDEFEDEIEDTPADARLKRRDISDPDTFFLIADNITEERIGNSLHRDTDYRTEKTAFGVPVDSSTIGDESYRQEDNGSEGVNICTDTPSKMVRELEEFFEMIEEFREKVDTEKWIVSPILIDPSAKPVTLPLNFLPKPKIRATWHLVPDGTNRTRQFACVEVKTPGHPAKYAYILELELVKPSEGQCIAIICSHDGGKVKYGNFRTLLRLLIHLTHWPNLENDAWRKTRYKKAAAILATQIRIEKLNHRIKDKPAAIKNRIEKILRLP